MDGNQSDSDHLYVPDDVKQEARVVGLNLLPVKSRLKYEKEYDLFCEWREDRNVKGVSEDVLLAYFAKKSENLKSSTLWSLFSMLKATLEIKENACIGGFAKLIAFLKRSSVGYEARKSKTFTRQELQKFFLEAPNDEFLLVKVVMIFGLAEACRRDELTRLNIQDVQDKGSLLIVTLPQTKTNKKRVFTVTDDEGLSNFLELYRKYVGLRPGKVQNSRLFLNYRNGKCTVQPVGVHKIAGIPKQIARFLKLEEPGLYTGHCYRRTSATFLVESGANLQALKRHGGWKSSTVAENYVDESIGMKMDVSRKILGGLRTEKDPKSAEMKDVSVTACSTMSFPTMLGGFQFENVKDCSFSFNFGGCTSSKE